MTNNYGPPRSELKFRLAFSVAGLALMLGGIAVRGWPTGPGGWEAVILASVFFGGTTLWTLRKLIKRDHPDGL